MVEKELNVGDKVMVIIWGNYGRSRKIDYVGEITKVTPKRGDITVSPKNQTFSKSYAYYRAKNGGSSYCQAFDQKQFDAINAEHAAFVQKEKEQLAAREDKFNQNLKIAREISVITELEPNGKTKLLMIRMEKEGKGKVGFAAISHREPDGLEPEGYVSDYRVSGNLTTTTEGNHGPSWSTSSSHGATEQVVLDEMLVHMYEWWH